MLSRPTRSLLRSVHLPLDAHPQTPALARLPLNLNRLARSTSPRLLPPATTLASTAVPGLLRCFSSSTSVKATVQPGAAGPGPVLSQTNRAEVTRRRFWQTVHIKEEPHGDFLVTLDARTLKTPGGARLVIPRNRRLLALLIANEWENQSEVFKQHALPVTSLASRAVDGLQNPVVREGVIDAMMKYLDTDTILYPSDTPAPLVRMQREHWDPLFAWLKEAYGVTLVPAEGFSVATQSDEVLIKLRSVVEQMDHWELAAFERAIYASKSFVIALALLQGKLTAHQAAEASHVEVRSQIEQWGEVEDTHDVDYQDIRRSLGSVACLLIKA